MLGTTYKLVTKDKFLSANCKTVIYNAHIYTLILLMFLNVYVQLKHSNSLTQTRIFNYDSYYHFITVMNLNDTYERRIFLFTCLSLSKFLLFFKTILLLIRKFNLLCYGNIFVGVLRDTSMPMAPTAYVLSASQSRPFQYIMDALSAIEPVYDEYLEEKQGNIERYNVSKL